MFGPGWRNYLGHISKSKYPNEIDTFALNVCREIFKNITGFSFSLANQFRNKNVKTPHRIIVKANQIGPENPDGEYPFKCNRDEFLFKAKDNDWIVFMCLSSCFKKAYILGKYYLKEFMPVITKNASSEFYFQAKYFIPVEFNMDQIQCKKGRTKSHNVRHGIKICH